MTVFIVTWHTTAVLHKQIKITLKNSFIFKEYKSHKLANVFNHYKYCNQLIPYAPKTEGLYQTIWSWMSESL